MAFKISDFKNALKYDGARPNLFEVKLSGAQLTGFKDINLYAKSAQIPGGTIGTVPLFYFGREMKLAGNRTFADWTITIINDEDFAIRKLLEQWMNSINSHANNQRASNFVSPSTSSADAGKGYMGTAHVLQYGKTQGASPIKAYTFNGIFPIDLSPIDLDWGSNDTVEEYSVTFAYQYWTAGTTDEKSSEAEAAPQS